MDSELLKSLVEKRFNPVVTIKEDFEVYEKGKKADVYKATDTFDFYLDFSKYKNKKDSIPIVTVITEDKVLNCLEIKAIDNPYLDLKIQYINSKTNLQYIDWLQEKLSIMQALYE